jgi:hypothetical protein
MSVVETQLICSGQLFFFGEELDEENGERKSF